MSHQRIGSAEWTVRNSGILTRNERLQLMRPLLRGLLENVVGRTRMALHLHSGRRAHVDAAALEPPDSALVRDAQAAAIEQLPPVLLNHSERTYAWGAALAALDEITFDRELRYVAALLHDIGLTKPVAGRDFTLASIEVVGRIAGKHNIGEEQSSRINDSICLHHTPGVTLDDGAESFLLSAGAAVDVFGIRSWDVPDQMRSNVVESFPRAGFKREFASLWRDEARAVPHGRAWFLRRYAVSDVMIPLAPFKSRP